MNLSWQTVVSYVKNLFPDNAPVRVSDNPRADARVVAYICSGDVFYMNQMGGDKYWQVFVTNVKDVDLVRYILRSNGLNPKASRAGMMMSVRVSDVKNNSAACKFMDMVLNQTVDAKDYDAINKRIGYVRQIMANQKAK